MTVQYLTESARRQSQLDLVARGHEVHVVCAPPYYPSWKVQPGYRADRYQTEQVRPGLTVHRCPVWIPKRLGGLARLLHLASFALASLPVLLRLVLWQPQVVFAVAPALACAPFAWLTARLAGARAWLHMQDLEVDAAFELGMLRRPLMRRLALGVERFVLRRFDVVSTISSRMMRKLAVKGLPLHETEFLPNWVDGTAIHERLKHQGVTLVLSGRNLGYPWTKYPGMDPESNDLAGNFAGGNRELTAQPPLRYWLARVNVTF